METEVIVPVEVFGTASVKRDEVRVIFTTPQGQVFIRQIGDVKFKEGDNDG